jgi:hypothetical protein
MVNAAMQAERNEYLQAAHYQHTPERIIQLAAERKVTQGRKLSKVVESNIRPPSDSRLLADGIRVLTRTVVRARVLLEQKVQEPFEDFIQTARKRARQIGETLRKKTEAAKSAAVPRITRNDPKNDWIGSLHPKTTAPAAGAESQTVEPDPGDLPASH